MKKTTTNFNQKATKSFLFLLSIFCVFALSNFAYAQKKDAPAKKAAPDKLLAGKIFTTEITATGGKKAADPESDEISFKSGNLTSNLMKKESGFKPSPYTASLDSSNAAGAVINFECEMTNPDSETLKWSGTITMDDVEGTAVLTNKKGKVKKEYTFTGSKKGLKKKKEKEVE